MFDVAFRCSGCKVIAKTTVRLRYRGEDIYLKGAIMPAVSDHHDLLSPVCTHRVCDLAFGLAKDQKEGIGVIPNTITKPVAELFDMLDKEGKPV